ncbi:MAG: PTS sugar transporter subunit IIA [Candidatus Brocadia sp.]|nr:PTS sugar transporter subunit IIA [Candidatus Brocadia sp.]
MSYLGEKRNYVVKGGSVKLSDVLTKERIIINLNGRDKYDVLEKMVQVTRTSERVTNEIDLLKKVIEREKIKSTGIGGGIGIPHAQTSGVSDIIACLGISEQGIEFNAVDGKPVHLVFLIATKERTDSRYLGLLSRIARLFIDEPFKQRIIKSNSSEEIMRLIIEKEKE